MATATMSERDRPVRLIFILLLVNLVAITGCANQARLREQAGTHIGVGSAFIAAGQYTSALKELLEAERLTPDDPKVQYLLGVSYHGKGLYDQAISRFQKAITLKPDDPEVHNFLGAVYLELGRTDEAIASFKLALSNILYETPTATHYNLGKAYFQKGNYEESLAQYKSAVDADPYSVLMPLIQKEMGMVFMKKGDFRQAINHLRKSLELSPSLAEAHYRLGECHRALDNLDEARTAFQAAANLAPETEFGRKARENLDRLPPAKGRDGR